MAPALSPPAEPRAGDATTRGGGHIAGLDGLRGIAVAAVVAYHLGVLDGGFLGVDVFFVLSGFLITSLLLGEVETTGRVRLRSFWGRRVRRLVPAVVVMVPTVWLGALALDWPRTRLGDSAVDGFATLTWWANWRQASGDSYWAADAPNLFRHAWSLAIEEQLYIVWPLIVVAAGVIAARRRWPVRAVVGIAAACGATASATWMIVLSNQLADGDLSRVYVGTDTRAFALLAGAALASWRPGPGVERNARMPGALASAAITVGGVTGLATLAWMFAFVGVSDPGLYRNGGFVVATLAATAAVTAVTAATSSRSTDPVARWATWQPLRYLGLRSYGIYLWSWPLQVLAERRFPDAPRWALIAGVVAASLLIAETSYRIVEDPIRRRHSWTLRPSVRRPILATGALLPVVALLVVTHRSVEPPAHEQIDTAEALDLATGSAPPHADEPAGGRAGQTAREPTDRRPRHVMVIGDSISFSAVFHHDSENLPEPIETLDLRGVIGCGVLAADGWHYRSPDGVWVVPAGDGCTEQARAEQRGLAAEPDLVLAMPGGFEFSATRLGDGPVIEAQSPEMAEVLTENLTRRATAAHEAGASFAVLEWSCPGPEDTRPQRAEPDYIRWVNGVFRDAVERARANGVEAFMIDATEEVCEGGDPANPPTPARLEATANEVHFVDQEGAQWFWHEWIAPALNTREW